MRDIKTLLKLMRRKLIWYMLFDGYDGLCIVLGAMKDRGCISHKEFIALGNYLEIHKPDDNIYGYWWRPGEILPRYRFLSRLIREL